jgi:threonine dehydratase
VAAVTDGEVVPVDAGQVTAAAHTIAGHVRRTPTLVLEPGVAGVDVPVVCKLESQQITGSFKVRNAVALLHGADLPEAGVVAVSGGNFGLAVAHAAARFGHRATVFVPAAAAAVKVDGIRALGADVRTVAGSIRELFTTAEAHVEATGAWSAHPFDQVESVAGAGTVGRELDDQHPGLDTVLVAVGGGGLIAGVAGWFGGRCRIVGVETEGTPTLHRARANGGPTEVAPTGIAVSALGAPRLGRLGWEAARRWVDDAVLVTDDAVTAAQRRLWDAARTVTEAGGATAFAALLSGAYVPQADERVGVIVCGANTDPNAALR